MEGDALSCMILIDLPLLSSRLLLLFSHRRSVSKWLGEGG